MRTRFTWIVAIVALVAIGVLMACSDKYTSHFDGLVVVSTYTGDAVMETFSLDLGNGQMTQINNVNGPPTPGAATGVLLDPAGAFAYVIVTENSAITPSSTGIATYQVESDGKLSAVIGVTPLTNPVAMAMDSAGKLLFVANGTEGTVSVFSIGSNASLTPVGSASLPALPGGQPPNATALAVTPTAYPVLDAPCTAHTPPTTENLYVTDYLNNLLFNYSVSSAGSLTLVPTGGSTQGVATDTEPNGVAVDPCNRFVYVANALGSSVSAYTICSVVSLPQCPNGDYSLLPVAGSPFKSGNGAGPLTVDAYGHFLYVLSTGAYAVYSYSISATNGALTPMTPPYVGTGAFPTSIAIRNDDSFMVVTNFNGASLSEYGVTPGDGALTVQPTVPTFNYPWGVALK